LLRDGIGEDPLPDPLDQPLPSVVDLRLRR